MMQFIDYVWFASNKLKAVYVYSLNSTSLALVSPHTEYNQWYRIMLSHCPEVLIHLTSRPVGWLEHHHLVQVFPQ